MALPLPRPSIVRPSYAAVSAPFSSSHVSEKPLPKIGINVTQVKGMPLGIAARPVPVGGEVRGTTSNLVAPKEEWSEHMKAYVERCFASCRSAIDRDSMECLLRDKIKNSIADGSVARINWSKEPIPSSALRPFLNPMSVPVPSTASKSDSSKLSERARRFEADARAFQLRQEQNRIALQNVSVADNQGHVIDWDEYTIVGTCQVLEKPYLRLTSAPDPSTVRPLPVLKKTLAMLKDKWKRGAVEYGWICDQFKSLRQDLTVQRIRSDFTVQVYEIHGRIAIEKNDLGEYNQCQTQLKQLYALGLNGCQPEFLGYRLLYLLHCRNRQDVNMFLCELGTEHAAATAIQHALQVRNALILGDYVSLFRLYQTAPNMGGYLMDCFIERERKAAMLCICKAYRPSVSISFLRNVLAFTSLTDCGNWLSSVLNLPRHVFCGDFVDCRAAVPFLSD